MKTIPPEKKHYDLVIIGGGVSGTALFYALSKYSTVKSIAIIEKYGTFGQINYHRQRRWYEHQPRRHESLTLCATLLLPFYLLPHLRLMSPFQLCAASTPV